MFTNSTNCQNATSPVSIPITMNTANVEAPKKVKYDDLLSSYEDFVKAEKIPLIYLTGWFRDALNYALANFDDDYCDKLMLKYEGIDWSKGFKGPSLDFLLGPDSYDPASTAYYDFVGDMLLLVPLLHLRGKREKMELLVGMAAEAYAVNAILFTRAFRFILQPYMDYGAFVTYGYIDYGWCTVNRFYHCYAIRVLRSQPPFSSVHLHEVDGVIEGYEVALLKDDLDRQCDEIESEGMCPYNLMRKVRDMYGVQDL